jgi:hypothetical protein
MKRMDGFDKCILQSLIPWETNIADVDCSVAVHFSSGSAKKKILDRFAYARGHQTTDLFVVSQNIDSTDFSTTLHVLSLFDNVKDILYGFFSP